MSPTPDIDLSKRRVVIADDDATTRVLVRAALEQDGWIVNEASDGVQACEVAARIQADIVVLDVGMPRLDGFEACARLRTLPHCQRVPVMIITATDDQDSINRAYEVGATDFLSKPLSFVVLRQRLKYMYRAERDSRDLRTQRDFASAVVDRSAALVLILDREGRIVRFNESCADASGLSAGEAQGQLVWEALSAEEERDRERRAFERLVSERGTHHYEGTWTTASGGRREISWSNSVLLDADGNVQHVVCTGLDTTARIQAEERANFLTWYDPLTGLPNRGLLTERLDRAIAATDDGEQVAIAILNLDRFKNINATFGRHAGDILLKEVSERLLKSLRLSNVLARQSHPLQTELGRLGGDEFGILVSQVHEISALSGLVERLQHALVRPFRLSDAEVTLTGSVGAAAYPADGPNGETLLRHAEAALHVARETQRGSCHFYSVQTHTGASNRISLETELRQAVDRAEFVLYYQPKIFVGSGRLAGAEALLRWQHPSRGIVSPASFIQIAEETGLIEQIGGQALHQACDQIVHWIDDGITPVSVAVNLSSVQFHVADLLGSIGSILNETSLDPSHLAVEITESMIMRDAEKARQVLGALGELGIRVSIDDFGTGYSTLSSLKDLPIDQLKIDRAFIQDIAEDAKDLAITRAIITMAHGLGLTVVAEGVESEEQLQILRDEGCDEVQGFLVGRPIPSDEFAKLLEDRMQPCVAQTTG